MASKSSRDAEVSSTVKSTGSMEEEDEEILRISYKDVPDDFFENLIVDEWTNEEDRIQPMESPSAPAEEEASTSKAKPKQIITFNKAAPPAPAKKTAEPAKKAQKKDEKKDEKKEGSRKRSRSPATKKTSQEKSKRKRSASPAAKGSRSPRRRSPIRRSRSRSPRYRGSKRFALSPRRSPVRNRSPIRLSSTRRSQSPRRRAASRRRVSNSRSKSRSPNRGDLYTARMSSRRNNQKLSKSRSLSSASLSPDRTGKSARPYPFAGKRSRTPPKPFLNPLLQPVQPSLQEIASGMVPYHMPSYQPYGAPPQMMYYPQGGYPQHPMGYQHPAPMQPYSEMVPQAPAMTPQPVAPGTADPFTPFPRPVPAPAADYSPVMPSPSKQSSILKSAKKTQPFKVAPRAAEQQQQQPKFVPTFQESGATESVGSSVDPEEGRSSRNNGGMKLSDYLASLTASNKPMEYKKAVDMRIQHAIAKFDDSFLQPLRFTVTPAPVKLEPDVSTPNTSPLLKTPAVKLGNFIRPLNLHALRVPERPQFMCRKTEPVQPKPEISIKTLLSKKQPSKRDMACSPIDFEGYDASCQTDPIPDPPCKTCVERNKKTFMNHWTQVKRVEMVSCEVQTAELPRVAAPVAHRLGPIVDDAIDVRRPHEDLRANLRNSGANPAWNYLEQRPVSPVNLMLPHPGPRSMSPFRLDSPDMNVRRTINNYPRNNSLERMAPDEDLRRPVDRFADRIPDEDLRRPVDRFADRVEASPPARASPGYQGSLHCDDCDLHLNSHQQLMEHQNSSRHRLAVQRNADVLAERQRRETQTRAREMQDREVQRLRDEEKAQREREFIELERAREAQRVREELEVREEQLRSRQFQREREPRNRDFVVRDIFEPEPAAIPRDRIRGERGRDGSGSRDWEEEEMDPRHVRDRQVRGGRNPRDEYFRDVQWQ